MTLHFDKATEAIAHFIGLFEIKIEELRLREAHEEFTASRQDERAPPELPFVPVNVKAPYDLGEFNPDVPYKPLAPELVGLVPWSHVGPLPPTFSAPGDMAALAKPGLLPQHWSTAKSSSQKFDFDIDPPGSVALYTSQYIRLSDSDFVSIGGHGLNFELRIDNSAMLAGLIETARQVSPLADAEEPGSPDAALTFIDTASQQLDAHSAESGGEHGLFVAKSEALEGTYVNGELVDEAPRLEDYLPEPDETAADTPTLSSQASGSFAASEGPVAAGASVELEAGGNTLVNSVVLTNNWLQSHVLAVAGDHVELNVIVQINAWCDSDLVSPALNDWKLIAENPTQAFNIAMFKHLDPSAAEVGQTGTGDFPRAWAITEIEGDLLIMNWLEQFTFMTDEDVAILSCAGATTSIIAGGNTAVNNISLAELGSYYDLIFVGGHVYDANIIQQLNILFDNDLVGAVDGFGTSGEGSVSTGGNLLWNYAGIVEAGGAMSVKPMPQSYLDALDKLANGKKSLSNDVLQDDVFAGMNGLKVLYISGNLVNLNYVKQTTILGDSDQVALAKSALVTGSDGDWSISTGSNVLVNHAGILDVDTGATIYAGGGAYSDEVLIQAELITDEPYLGGQDPDALVNEAVAFLGDDMMAPDPGPQPMEHGQSDFGRSHNDRTDKGPSDHASPHIDADPMHSMLA
ncbi:type I secretion protein [Sinorhizobium alkalisoli]|uniref:Type I secretion protein n=1 Tax=Sinorhizobium alkalisoli TaxID=1752398 RepID=A0A1E3VBD4_9HYPH|nr:type I secretion protein [Sinorhizobium alkalisoli]MCG5478730.1 type I secretion protein [Sinorhizobium alkalisoli]ODR90441.1 type I secretion protein [Sinorhizobium alkalisoli]